MSKTLGIVLVLQYQLVRIGIGHGIGSVYGLSGGVVLVLELFTQALKNWYVLVLELELFIPCLKNWYWNWNCLTYV